ncbi:MAG: DUF4019 domain-containing protein [Beijerinckiaceae bacterium]|jgi:hypothetical protein|nr:DUF4019 domain-containing protein [Beijerinckiaceae bacterium]
MLRLNCLIALTFIGLSSQVAATPYQVPPPPAGPRQVNITSVSEPGWLPSEALEAEARAFVTRYFDLVDGGQIAAAHALQSAGLRAEQPIDAFKAAQQRAAAELGPAVSRSERKLTWTKNPPGVPTGSYAAFDWDARFVNSQRACGYIVVRQAEGSAGFEMVRIEQLQLLDAQYAEMVSKRGAAAVDAEWQGYRAQYCPN